MPTKHENAKKNVFSCIIALGFFPLNPYDESDEVITFINK